MAVDGSSSRSGSPPRPFPSTPVPRRAATRSSTAGTKKKAAPRKLTPKTKKPAPNAIDPARQRLANQVLKRLKADYPDAVCALEYDSAFQLLVATILSAQCTDERVNIVTKDLFAKYRTAEDLARIPIKTLENLIQSTGFFRNKAKSIKACAQALVEKHGGEVPRDLDELVAMPGIGRKTANVVLGTAYGLATGVVVDTHVGRLSRRTGLTAEKDPEKVERDLMQLLPEREWVNFAHRMIHHGRKVCVARKPRCEICSMNRFCPKIGVS